MTNRIVLTCSLRGGEVPSPPSNDGNGGSTSCPPQPPGGGEVVKGPSESGRQLTRRTQGQSAPPMKTVSEEPQFPSSDSRPQYGSAVVRVLTWREVVVKFLRKGYILLTVDNTLNLEGLEVSKVNVDNTTLSLVLGTEVLSYIQPKICSSCVAIFTSDYTLYTHSTLQYITVYTCSTLQYTTVTKD